MRLHSKFFYGWIAVFVALELLSFIGFNVPTLGAITAGAIVALVAVLSWWRLEWGLYAILAELFVGGKGYLFSLPIGSVSISLRLALFLIVLGIWISKQLLDRTHRSIVPRHSLSGIFLAFSLFVGYAVMNGLLRYPFAVVFFDANAWLFWLLLPMFVTVLKSPPQLQRLFTILFASIMVVSVKTAWLLYVFGHADAAGLDTVYRWVRDTGVGEITQVTGSLFRIFFQSHLYALAAWISALALLVGRQIPSRIDAGVIGAVLYATSLTLLVSQSRSLWFGWVIGLLAVVSIALFWRALTVGRAVVVAALLVMVVQSQLALVGLISGNYAGHVVAARLYDLGQEPAASSRQNQFLPLIAAIQDHPLLGSGFGRQVTYLSRDPRILREHPDGRYTTTAFEWGYLDIALKIGLLGLLAYALWVGGIIYYGLKKMPHEWGTVCFAASAALIGIVATNVFTPYLNHPLGIGWVLVCAAASYAKNFPRARQSCTAH